MTEPLDLGRLLACCLYKLGGELEISQELLDNMKPVRLVLDNTRPEVLRLAILSNEILVGELDNDAVNVVDFQHEDEDTVLDK